MIGNRNILNIVDAHCHLHEFQDVTIEKICTRYTIVAVSDDEQSSLRTLKLAEKYETVIPCVGIHPWMIDKVTSEEIERTLRLCDKAMCIGEVGLDTKFVPETIDRQREVFVKFVRIARELSLPINLHCAGTWQEVYDIVMKYDIDKAIFHWYTGPLELVDKIVNHGFYISINPAVKIQKKHQEVARRVPLSSLLLESDGPYEYRGLKLEPFLIENELVDILAKLKGVSKEEIIMSCRENIKRIFNI